MTVDEYINGQTPEHARILRWLRQLILTADASVREKIAWNVPVYTYQRQHVCYLTVLRSEPVAVDLAFMQGAKLPDEAGLLESRGRKLVRSLVIRDPAELDEDVIRTYVQEALLLIKPRSD